jgi:hypothetical protein
VITYIPEPCPDSCGHGTCVNGLCQCQKGYRGLNCQDDTLLELTSAEAVVAGLATGVVAAIVIVVVLVVAATVGGSAAFYKWQRGRTPMNTASMNPLYDDKGRSGNNPFYK